MDLKNIILILFAVLDLGLGLVIFLRGKRKEINIAYSLFVLWGVLWSIGIALFRYTTDLQSLLFWNREFILTAALIGSSLLHFSFVFPYCKIKLTNLKRFLIYTPNLLILIAIMAPEVMIKDIVIHDWGNESILGWGYIYYGIYFAIISIWAFINLWKKYKESKGIVKVQLLYVLIGLSIALAFGATFNLIYILLGNYKYIWLGPYASFFMLAFIGYAILKHHLMDIKVIATELLAFVIVVFSFIQIFLPDTTHTTFIKICFFFGVLIIGMLLIKGVILEVKRREELQDLNFKLKALDETKSEFISIASHQLKTPLGFIKGNLSMALNGTWGNIPHDLKMELEKVSINNERLIKLVDELLDISRIETGRMEFNFQHVSLEEITESMIKDFLPLAKKKNLYLEYRKSEKPLPKVNADHLKICQVVMNLIDNAIKYTKEGGVTVGLREENNCVLFWVKDTGIGISTGHQKLLFHKFSRAKEVTQAHIEGMGLGLYLCAVLIRAHKGRIWVESEGEGKGSKFCFEMLVVK